VLPAPKTGKQAAARGHRERKWPILHRRFAPHVPTRSLAGWSMRSGQLRKEFWAFCRVTPVSPVSSGPRFGSFQQENVAAYSSAFLPPADPCSCVSLFAFFRSVLPIRKARYLYALLHYTTTLHPYNRYSYKCYLSGLPLDNRQDSFSTVGDGQGLVMSRCVL